MIRVVDLRKALLAGAAGALAWALVLQALLLAGWVTADLPTRLGLLILPSRPGVAAFALGLPLHLAVGALVAVIYAYVFWALFEWRPAVQGLAFGLLTGVVTAALLYPLLTTLQADADVIRATLFDVIARVSWGERIGLLLGNLIYGALVGLLYRNPVGAPVDRPAPMPRKARRSSPGRKVREHDPAAFIFATGVENSYCTIEEGRWRRDEMASTGHYRHWEEDFELAADLGVTHLRWGPPLHLTYPARGRFDWSFADIAIERLQAIGLEPIVDLCHFGLPTWLASFQNPEVPGALADYAAAFARRYPGLRFYTPVNEIYVASRLSALAGLWNEQFRDERAFVTATKHAVRASLSMCERILEVRPDAVMINSESSEFYQPCCPDPHIRQIAEFENERRFLALDLLFSHPVSDRMRGYLRDHGMSDGEYEGFMASRVPARSVLGVDYYEWNEKLIASDGQPRALGELFGWYVIAQQYWQRYGRPMMHTETNRMDAREAPRWLLRQWHNVRLMQAHGVPVIGFTWYSLTDQVDWSDALRRAIGNVDPVGLFDLNRQPRAVGQAYRYLIESFGDMPELAQYQPLHDLLDGKAVGRWC